MLDLKHLSVYSIFNEIQQNISKLLQSTYNCNCDNR
jgi:hypothetical protein